MNGIRDSSRLIIAVAMLLAFFVLAHVALSVFLGTAHFLATVTSDSMVPALQRGDWVVIQKQPAYRPDDVVVFDVGRSTYVHRVVAVPHSNAAGAGVDGAAVPSGYRTQGDANAYPDGWTVPIDAVRGKVVLRIPWLGYLSLWLDGQ